MITLPRIVDQKSADLRQLQSAVLNLVDLHVRKEYLNEIESATIVPLSAAEQVLIPEKNMRLFHIETLSYAMDTKVSERIKVVFESLTQDCGSIVFFVNGKKNHADLYMGVCAQDADKLAGQYALAHGAFRAVCPGSHIKRLKNSGNGTLIQEFFPENERLSVAALSGVPMDSYESKPAVVEHLDALLDAMKHKPFTLMVIAQPISHRELVAQRRELENLYSEIFPYQKQDISLSQNESQSFGKNFSTTITRSTSVTTGTSTAHTEGESNGTNDQEVPDHSAKERSEAINSLVGAGISAIVTLSTGNPGAAEVMRNLFYSNSISKLISSAQKLSEPNATEPKLQHSTNHSDNHSDTFTQQENKTEGNAEAEQEGTNETESYTSGKTVQVSYINKPVADLLNLIDSQIAELREAEKTPMFNVGAYIIAGDQETALNAAHIYRSIVSSYGKVSRTPNVYKWSAQKDVSEIIDYLKRGRHPVFSFNTGEVSIYPQIRLAQAVKSSDMPAYFCLPEKTTPGINVVQHAPFTRDVIYRNSENGSGERIHIGHIFYMGQEDRETPVTLPVDALTKHMFVAGATGVGKSNCCYHLIDELIERGKKVLIIEPAKGEYAKVFGGRDGFEVYGTNINVTQLLRINPFAFPAGISVEEHIDSLMDIFNNAWPMYSAMPAILKDALERIYKANGFDLKYQTRTGEETFPTFKELLEVLPQVIKNSEYSKEVQGNYIGALVTRIKSMTNGVYGTIFCRNELGDEKLFDSNVIIDISRIRSEETKALIMGVLVNRLSEYRMRSGVMNSPLRHVTLLEEAHHLLRRHAASSSAEGANIRGASVEMISNAIAEMRTYGEGFVIADQSPSVMDRSAMSNTQTKVFFMLPEREDRVAAASSVELNVDQQADMARLPIGTAVVYQNAWAEPVLTKIHYFEKEKMKPYVYTPRNILQENREFVGQTLATLLYRRLKVENRSSTYDEKRIDGVMKKDYPWLGDAEVACRRILQDRTSLIQRQTPASKIADLCDYVFDFEEQVAMINAKTTLEMWLNSVKEQLRKMAALNDDELNELIGALLMNRRTENSGALKIYGEYMKLISKK